MIAAVVLAAGQSKRMGRPKMILPWKNTTVIGRVVAVLQESGVNEICVVTGAVHEQVEAALDGLNVKTVLNSHFELDEMAVSLQVGLENLPPKTQAALVVLGDQPQIRTQVVESLIQAYETHGAWLVVPSYQMHRGHPWLISQRLWPEVMNLRQSQTLHDLLIENQERILYVPVDTDTILRDLDTPDDYRREVLDR